MSDISLCLVHFAQHDALCLIHQWLAGQQQGCSPFQGWDLPWMVFCKSGLTIPTLQILNSYLLSMCSTHTVYFVAAFEHPTLVQRKYYYPQGQISAFHQECCGEKCWKHCQLVSDLGTDLLPSTGWATQMIFRTKILKSLSQPHLLRGVWQATEAMRRYGAQLHFLTGKLCWLLSVCLLQLPQGM